MDTTEKKLETQLQARDDNNNLRKLPGPSEKVDFVSNDYLGLARSEVLYHHIREAYDRAAYKRNGATGSRLLSGNTSYAENLEKQLAAIFKTAGCLLFNTGYMANLGILSAIPKKGDTIIYDALSHACIKDGARLSLATYYSFRHNDLHDLENKMKRSKGDVYVVIEAVYSMDGDSAPLPEILGLCKKHKAYLIVDEAHSTGIAGPEGGGLVTQLGFEQAVFARIHTFGKAMGTHGACVVGSETLINYLINFSRSFIYTTALPLHALVSIKCAFDYLAERPYLQKDLNQRVNTFCRIFEEKIKVKTINKMSSLYAIQPVIVPGNENVKSLTAYINQKGFDVKPVLSPTVKEGTERLRICLHAYNQKEDMEALIATIEQYINKEHIS